MTRTDCSCPGLPDLIAAAMHGDTPVCQIHNPPAATEPHGNPIALNANSKLRDVIIAGITEGETK